METPSFPLDLISVYEPSEDTFLFLDALEKDLNLLKTLRPSICMEVGTGSGILIVSMVKNLSTNQSYFLANDINPEVGNVIKKTSLMNYLKDDSIEFMLSNLFTNLTPREQFDLVIFNPPYLPNESVFTSDILEYAWYGGKGGREVINRFVDQVSGFVSKNGLVYLLMIQENKPHEVIQLMKQKGFPYGKEIVKRQCRNENLSVWRFSKTIQPLDCV